MKPTTPKIADKPGFQDYLKGLAKNPQNPDRADSNASAILSGGRDGEDHEGDWIDHCIDQYTMIQKKLGFKSVWSIFQLDPEKLDTPAYSDCGGVIYTQYGDTNPVVVHLPESPTWLKLWQAAERCVKESGDDHHVFIERFKKTNKPAKRQGTFLYELVTGS